MTARRIFAIALYAAFWTGFMIWWSGDTGIANIVILSICGVIVATVWAWAMQRFGYPTI
ncbi:hypothetical protein [Pseudorhodoplanes sp.]|uniref:hypothetical protein n=1 Tax=Pseudorhodoplanes sp. TaxID=1934341 RepID=UPI00391C30B2